MEQLPGATMEGVAMQEVEIVSEQEDPITSQIPVRLHRATLELYAQVCIHLHHHDLPSHQSGQDQTNICHQFFRHPFYPPLKDTRILEDQDHRTITHRLRPKTSLMPACLVYRSLDRNRMMTMQIFSSSIYSRLRVLHLKHHITFPLRAIIPHRLLSSLLFSLLKMGARDCLMR